MEDKTLPTQYPDRPVEQVYKQFLELNVEAKVKGYKSSEGEETFDAPTETDITSRDEH